MFRQNHQKILRPNQQKSYVKIRGVSELCIRIRGYPHEF